MSVKAWTSLCLLVPHQLCSAPAALTLNVILALLWYDVTPKCCAFSQSLGHGCTYCTILAPSSTFTSISRAQPAPSCSLSCMPFGLCPIIWYRCLPEIFMLGYAAGLHMTWCWNYIAMWYQMPAFSYNEGHVLQPVLYASEWNGCKYQGSLATRFSTSILGSVTACFLQTYN